MAIDSGLLERAGISLSPKRFQALVEEVVAELPAVGVTTASSDLTSAEADALRRGGLDLSPLRPDEADPVARAAAAYAALIASSLTVQPAHHSYCLDPPAAALLAPTNCCSAGIVGGRR